MYVYLYRTLYYFYSPLCGVGVSTSALDARGPGSIPLMGIILIFSKACSTNKSILMGYIQLTKVNVPSSQTVFPIGVEHGRIIDKTLSIISTYIFREHLSRKRVIKASSVPNLLT